MKQKWLCVLSIWLSVWMWASSLQAQTAASFIARSRQETDPVKQISILTQGVNKWPRSALLLHHRADAYKAQGKTTLAVRDYTRAISLTPKDPFRYYARALAYMDGHQYTLAAADLTRAISLKKDYPAFYLHRADAYLSLEKYTQSISDYKKYLSKRKKTTDIALSLAQAYIKTYKYSAAAKELTFARNRDPEQPDSYFWQGRMAHNQNQLDEAVSWYSKAINRAEDYAPAYRYRAAAFKEMQDWQAAAEDYTHLLALQEEPIFYNQRGLVYEEMQAWDEALADYTKTIELSPKWPIAYNNRGYVYLKQKKYAQARHDLEMAVSLDDSLPTPYINLAGLAWLQKKDRRQVYRYLEKALQRNFRDFESLYHQDRKGWMFEGINNTSEFRAVMYR